MTTTRSCFKCFTPVTVLGGGAKGVWPFEWNNVGLFFRAVDHHQRAALKPLGYNTAGEVNNGGGRWEWGGKKRLMVMNHRPHDSPNMLLKLKNKCNKSLAFSALGWEGQSLRGCCGACQISLITTEQYIGWGWCGEGYAYYRRTVASHECRRQQ